MGPVVLSNAPIVYVIFRSVIYSPLSLEVVENPNKCKSFLAPLFGGATTPIFLRQILSAIHYSPFGKVLLCCVC